jgi:hypothetical protein
VWYKWVADAATATLSTCGSPMDTALSVFDGCGGANLICLDDFCGLQTQITVGGLTVGNTYYVGVAGFASQEGTFSLTLSDCGPTGACCVSGNCSVMSPTDCAAAGGSYQGDGSDCGGYDVARANVAMEDISGSGALGCAGDDCSTVVPLGFTFTFYGVDFTDINVGSNGHMAFGHPATVFGNPASLPTADGYNNIVAPYWDDWRTDAICPGGTARLNTQTLGAAPNRRFIAQWTNVCAFSDNSQRATFQAILYEANDSIEYRYGTPLAFLSPVVGIEDNNGTDGENVTPIPTSGESVMISIGGDPCGCECAGDVDGSGGVNLADLALLLSAFGTTGPFANPCVDIDGSGGVNLADLAFLLSAFGTTCP